ncbi:MAG: hypothetical protein HOJ48_13415 [Desulfobacula sp.]|nr:hypothetical protein [Desulfobacula sp.]
MENLETLNCQRCGTVYQIRFLKPGENYNDFGIWFCPYCGDLTESIPDWVKGKTQKLGTNYVLISISGGLVDQVKFYAEPIAAVSTLSDFVKNMDVENEDAGVYDKDGLISNAKDFLDENDEFMENPEVFEKI